MYKSPQNKPGPFSIAPHRVLLQLISRIISILFKRLFCFRVRIWNDKATELVIIVKDLNNLTCCRIYLHSNKRCAQLMIPSTVTVIALQPHLVATWMMTSSYNACVNYRRHLPENARRWEGFSHRPRTNVNKTVKGASCCWLLVTSKIFSLRTAIMFTFTQSQKPLNYGFSIITRSVNGIMLSRLRAVWSTAIHSNYNWNLLTSLKNIPT